MRDSDTPDPCPTCDLRRNVRTIPGTIDGRKPPYPEAVTLRSHCSCPGGPAAPLRRDCEGLAFAAADAAGCAKFLLHAAREARDERHDIELCPERVRQA